MTGREQIVEAAAQLLREHGIRAVTTRAVAEAAGVQAPTIYRLFGDKDGLVDAVAEHVLSAYVAAKLRTHVDDDPVADLRAGWRSHIEFGLANPSLFTLMYSSERTAQSPAIAAGIEKLRARIRALATAGLLRVDEDRALAMVHAAGVGAVLAVLDGAADRRDPGFADAMFDAVASAILGAGTAVPDDSLRTVAITFGTLIDDLPALTDAERTLMSEWLSRSLAAARPGPAGEQPR
ncbi:TetR/AcrR family transcriptional regulator [Cryptosporangium sp. NPDC051539]|uniref:TetR/AcrR family transcriptional regulator n=1 Tax=Cryptosporangium sp. NPDC051539 TaxID=3363962 RepID=UPI0037A68228